MPAVSFKLVPGSKTVAPLLLLLASTGCVMGPDYKPADASTLERYGVGATPAETVSAPGPGGEAQRFLAGRELPDRWWTLFGSAKLNALVDEALKSSPSVASAQAALRVAQASLKASGAALYPEIEASAGATRQKIDTGSFGNPNGGSTIYNLFNAQVGVSYGIDLFGGTRRGIEAEIARAEFQRYQSEAAYQTLIANVVTAAVQEALVRKLLEGQLAILADQEKTLKVSQTQFELGGISRADLLIVQSQLASERAKLPQLRAELSAVQNQLAVYLGKAPSEQAASNFELDELTLPQDLPVSLPSTLVRQRPDVLAAEASLRTASANVGIAAANRFPTLALSASYGTQSSKASDLFSSDIWSLGGNLTAPLFNYGALSSLFKGSQAAYEQSTADYKLTVLNAFRDVADSLRQLETDAELLQAQYEASSVAEEALRLSQLQYELGAASYLQLLTAQQQRITARTGYTQARAARLQDTVALFQALGGGWTARQEAATAKP